MTTAVLARRRTEGRGPFPFLAAASGLWTAFRARRERRAAEASILRLGPRLARDMGVDPETHAADPWGALPPIGLLRVTAAGRR